MSLSRLTTTKLHVIYIYVYIINIYIYKYIYIVPAFFFASASVQTSVCFLGGCPTKKQHQNTSNQHLVLQSHHASVHDQRHHRKSRRPAGRCRTYHPWGWHIYLHEWLIVMVNVGKYAIHGWYDFVFTWVYLRWFLTMISTKTMYIVYVRSYFCLFFLCLCLVSFVYCK